jgi:hypothetical protein
MQFHTEFPHLEGILRQRGEFPSAGEEEWQKAQHDLILALESENVIPIEDGRYLVGLRALERAEDGWDKWIFAQFILTYTNGSWERHFTLYEKNDPYPYHKYLSSSTYYSITHKNFRS